MTDQPGGARRDGRPANHHGTGARFRRPLTEAEMASIEAATQLRGRRGGALGGIIVLWDILLGEAEGLSWDESVQRGFKFQPNDYAVPDSQSTKILALLRRNRGRGLTENGVGRLWLDIGPGSYPDDDHA